MASNLTLDQFTLPDGTDLLKGTSLVRILSVPCFLTNTFCSSIKDPYQI